MERIVYMKKFKFTIIMTSMENLELGKLLKIVKE